MANTPLTTPKMIKALEELDFIHRTQQINTCSNIYPEHKSLAIPINHGIAAITSPLFERKLNRVTGFGMGGPVSEKDLITLEDIYQEIGRNPDICMCPFAHPSAFEVLAARGYTVESSMHFYVRTLTDEDLEEVKLEGVKLFRVSADKVQDFPTWSVAGYKDAGRAEVILEAVGRIAAAREDTTLYMATVGGKIAGSAAMALIQTSESLDAHLYIDSVLPEYRGRGIQVGLLRARVADARRAGCRVASVQANTDNPASCKSIERAGFGVAYDKTWYRKL